MSVWFLYQDWQKEARTGREGVAICKPSLLGKKNRRKEKVKRRK
jgi:hypothetical protein